MKRAYLLLIIVIIVYIMIGCSKNDSLNSSEYDEKVNHEIQTLYNEKSQEISINIDKLIALRKQILNSDNDTSFSIERSKDGKWQYYTEDYKLITLKIDDKLLEKIISTLFDDLDVEKIEIKDEDIRFYISEDALIYSKNKIEEDVRTEYIKGNWYHFHFPYGI